MRRRDLQPRDFDILGHVARYRLTTLETVHRLFFEGSTVEAPKTVLRGLRAGGYLQSRPLYIRRAYYQLTTAAAGLLGEPPRAASPLGPQALVRAYGVLAHCCHGDDKERRRLTRAEFEAAFSYLHENGVPFDAFYVERDSRLRLVRVIVDQGGDAKRLLRKCTEIRRRAATTPGFQDLLRAGEFELAVVTAAPEKMETLRVAYEARDELRSFPVRFDTVAELTHLLPNHMLGVA